jgi:hypothetical protein
MLAWAVDGTDFRPSRSGGGSVRAAAHGLRECRRAMERRRGQVAGPQDFGPLGRCTHVGVGARRDRFSTIDKRGRRCLREPAHGLRERPRAMARPGRPVPDVKISALSVVACMLAWACDATDFRPSINGVGNACASRRTVCESSRERVCDGAGWCRTSRIRPRRSLHAYWRGHAKRPIFDHRETGSAVLARAGARSERVPRVMARRGRLVPDLKNSAPSVVARMLVWAGDATDFRPSINDKRGRRCLREPAHGLRECRGAMA